jgi:hypothetical protein
MFRRLFSVLLLALTSCAFAAPSASTLDATLDTAAGLRGLCQAVAAKEPIKASCFYLVTGRFGIISVTSEEGNAFQARASLADGEWVNDSTILSFRALLDFNGDAWKPYGDKKSAEYVSTGEMVLVICSYEGSGKDPETQKEVPVLKVYRVIRL